MISVVLAQQKDSRLVRYGFSMVDKANLLPFMEITKKTSQKL